MTSHEMPARPITRQPGHHIVRAFQAAASSLCTLLPSLCTCASGTMQIDGSVQLKRWRWRKRTACCGMTWGCLTLTAFVLLLLLTEALLLFFLIPREPCVRFDSASPRFVTVNANSLSVNAFRYDVRVHRCGAGFPILSSSFVRGVSRLRAPAVPTAV